MIVQVARRPSIYAQTKAHPTFQTASLSSPLFSQEVGSPSNIEIEPIEQ